MAIDKKLLRTLRPEIDAALKAVGMKYGVKLTAASGAHDHMGIQGHFKLEVQLEQTADGKSAEQALFERDCESFGFTPSDYRKGIDYGGKKYLLTGFNTHFKAKKNPLVITGVECGDTYKMDIPLFNQLSALQKMADATKSVGR